MSFQDLIPPSNQSLHIHVETYIFEVSKIADMTLTMTFELYMDLMWEESRIIINHTSPSWGPAGNFMGSTNFIPEMWLPDIQIYMCKQFRKRQIVTDVAGLIIFKNRNVLYTVSTEVIIACPMKFNAYPLDRQLCKFLVNYNVIAKIIFINTRFIFKKSSNTIFLECPLEDI